MGTKQEDPLVRFMNIWNNSLSLLGVSSLKSYRTDSGEMTYKPSTIRLLNPAIITALLFYLLYLQIKGSSFDLNNLGNSIMIAYMTLTGNVVAALNVLSGAWNSKGYANIKHGFMKFSKTSLRTNVNYVMSSSIRYLAFFALIYCSSLASELFVYANEKHMLTMLELASTYIFEFYNFLGICHFSVCCFWLKQSFMSINENVERQLKETLESKSTRQDFFKQNSVHPADLKSKWIETIDFGDKSLVSKDTTDMESLKSFRSFYHDVYQLSLEVNKIFSTRNMLTVGHNFLLGTIFIYCGINELTKYTNDSQSITFSALITCFKWSAISFLSIYGLILPSTNARNEALKTATIIQELLAKTSDLELRAELHSFALQFVHEKVTFSPHGFFTLNNSLFLSIIGAVASYLVVLIQFRVSIL